MLNHFKVFIFIILCSNLLLSQNNQEIDLFRFNDIYYISSSDFCNVNNYECISYLEKGKFKIKFKSDEAIFSVNSSFVKFNDNTYHMANQVKFVNDTFFLPINSFIYFCNQLNLQFISTDLEKNKAFISNSFNIRDFSIKEKDNNYVLSIFSDIDFNNIPPILKLLNDNQLQISIPTGKINLSSSPINTLDNITVTQNLNETLFLFNSNNEILNYSYNIKQDRAEIIITQTIKPQYTQNASDWQINTIIIDPGHGGKDPGAVGYRNIKEKHIVLDISKQLGKLINQNMPNMKVIYTRDDDTFLGLKNRTSIANKNKGHIFISIHANASSAKSARGYEIFLLQPNSVDEAIDVAIRENASIKFEVDQSQYNGNEIIATLAQNAFLKESEKLATFVQAALKKELPKTRNRGIKQAGFHVLVGASMPNILIEVGFLTNKSEALLLNKSYYREQIAQALFEGVKDYIESSNY